MEKKPINYTDNPNEYQMQLSEDERERMVWCEVENDNDTEVTIGLSYTELQDRPSTREAVGYITIEQDLGLDTDGLLHASFDELELSQFISKLQELLEHVESANRELGKKYTEEEKWQATFM